MNTDIRSPVEEMSLPNKCLKYLLSTKHKDCTRNVPSNHSQPLIIYLLPTKIILNDKLLKGSEHDTHKQ